MIGRYEVCACVPVVPAVAVGLAVVVTVAVFVAAVVAAVVAVVVAVAVDVSVGVGDAAALHTNAVGPMALRSRAKSLAYACARSGSWTTSIFSSLALTALPVQLVLPSG